MRDEDPAVYEERDAAWNNESLRADGAGRAPTPRSRDAEPSWPGPPGRRRSASFSGAPPRRIEPARPGSSCGRARRRAPHSRMEQRAELRTIGRELVAHRREIVDEWRSRVAALLELQ